MKLFKLAGIFSLKYSLGVSESFNVLGLTPTLKELEKIVKQELIDPLEACKVAQAKFNQLVSPYLKMKPVNIYFSEDFEFFLHDLIHEAIREGSIARFKETDKQKPSSTRYSLQDYMDEDIAEYLSSSKMEGGLLVYVEYLGERLNGELNTPQDLARQINDLMSKDIETIQNPKQKSILNTLKKSLVFKIISDIEVAKLISLKKINIITKILLQQTRNFIESRVKSVPIIDNELVASLLRRWLIALKQDLLAM